MISVEEAINHIVTLKSLWGSETISLENSRGRILAENIFADRDYPPFNRAAMDGYAINSKDILENNKNDFEIAGEIFAGDSNNFILKPGQAIKIMTGAAVPQNLDAVIKKEDADASGKCVSFKLKSIKQFQNISLRGEDLKKDDAVIAKNCRINFGMLPVLASLGKDKIDVYRLPKVAVISTGNEIKPVSSFVNQFQIRDSNSYSICEFLNQYCIQPSASLIVDDNHDHLISAIKSLIDYDILIISGGVSAGDADFVPSALKNCGVKEIFHKVKIKPGKPIWFGCGDSGIRVFALPGNPFSVQVACKIFIEPYLRASFNLPFAEALSLPLAVNRKKKINFDEYLPGRILNKSGLIVDLLSYNGSGDITAILNSNGIVHHPANIEEINPGEEIKFYSWKNIL